MIEFLILGVALLVTGWATWPPRGEQGGWLALALVLLWGALVAIGWRRGILPGFAPWLVTLALIGALVGLTVMWSLTNLVARPRQREK